MEPTRADVEVQVVGIVNVTPDSFSDGGASFDLHSAIAHATRLHAEGAAIVDVGGESTRPGAAPVPVEEEIRRVVPVIEAVARAGIDVSVDTRHPRVAAAAIRAGARILNDVSGLRDPEMVQVAADAQVPVVIMHAPFGDMARTHRHRGSGDVVQEVAEFLARQAAMAIAAGVPHVVVDPGIGFGKSVDDNVRLIARLGELAALGHPVLVGASRKRTIGALTGVDEPARRDPGTIAMHLAAIARGARLVRVHDVAAHVQAIAVWQAVERARPIGT